MKGTKITYWITTSLIALLFAMDAVMFLTHMPKVAEGIRSLGYPDYLLNILGTAKLLAAIALMAPKFPRLKEWAYAGITFNMLGAAWSHIAMGEASKAGTVLMIQVIAVISYVMYRKIQAAKA